MRKLAAGNWKMNGTAASLTEIAALNTRYDSAPVDILICPPATLLSRVSDAAGPAIATGGQDCHPVHSGAHTGDIAPDMLKDAGASYVILGHSERRTDHHETDGTVRVKTVAALNTGLIPIVCVGETETQRDAGETLEVIRSQLSASLPDKLDGTRFVVAYEPVWAIGTGRVPTHAQIEEVHNLMRAELVARFGDSAAETRLLYGGSVKPGNAADIFALSNVDGALVGGASLKADDFAGIIDALAAA